MKLKVLSLVFLLFIFCSNNPYEDELSINAGFLFDEISSFEESDTNLDSQCELLIEEKEYYENDGIPLSFFVEYEYYKFRYLGGSQENVKNYLNSLFYYCDMGGIYEEHWKSLTYQENIYQQLALAPIEPVVVIDQQD